MDIDNDGDLDLLVGEKYESVHYYQRQSDGSLTEQPVLIKLEKPAPDLAYMSISPGIFDWNGDGKLDIILGSDVYKSGKSFPLRLYLNKGSESSPSFDTYDTLRDKNGSIIQARCARVAVGDLNLDGLKDLVVGEQKCSVYYYKNVGTKGNPSFEKHTLIPSPDYGIPAKPDFKQMNGFGYATPRIYDWNKDGKPDLLLSGYPSGEVWIYLNDAATPVNKMKKAESGLQQTIDVHSGLQSLQISYTTMQPAHVSMQLMDQKGRVVYSGMNSVKEAGIHFTEMKTTGLSNGVYFINLQVEKNRISKKVVLVK